LAIAFVSCDQTNLTLNPQALVENLLLPHFDGLLGGYSAIGHAMETPAQSKIRVSLDEAQYSLWGLLSSFNAHAP
jgi:hypothetical protein